MDNRSGYIEKKSFTISNGKWNKLEVVVYRTDNYDKDQFITRNFWIDPNTGERRVTRGIRINERDLKRLGNALLKVAETADKVRERDEQENNKEIKNISKNDKQKEEHKTSSELNK